MYHSQHYKKTTMPSPPPRKKVSPNVFTKRLPWIYIYRARGLVKVNRATRLRCSSAKHCATLTESRMCKFFRQHARRYLLQHDTRGNQITSSNNVLTVGNTRLNSVSRLPMLRAFVLRLVAVLLELLAVTIRTRNRMEASRERESGYSTLCRRGNDRDAYFQGNARRVDADVI